MGDNYQMFEYNLKRHLPYKFHSWWRSLSSLNTILFEVVISTSVGIFKMADVHVCFFQISSRAVNWWSISENYLGEV